MYHIPLLPDYHTHRTDRQHQYCSNRSVSIAISTHISILSCIDPFSEHTFQHQALTFTSQYESLIPAPFTHTKQLSIHRNTLEKSTYTAIRLCGAAFADRYTCAYFYLDTKKIIISGLLIKVMINTFSFGWTPLYRSPISQKNPAYKSNEESFFIFAM